MKPFLLTLLLVATVAAAKDKPREWQTGILQEVTMEKSSKLVGSLNGSNGNVIGGIHQRRDDATYYTIETDNFIYVVKRTLTRRHDKQLRVTTNASVKFAISGDDFYLLDEKGNEHKLSIEEKRAKQKPPPSTN